LIEQKTIPFYLRNTHESSDESLRDFARCTGRTVRVDRRTKTPKDGEIVLSVLFKCPFARQISVHPRFLFPWEPVVSDDVVVIKGPWLGTLGVTKAREESRWIVTLSSDGGLFDCQFEEAELAAIEDLCEDLD
jgi:hypothetical protein